MEELREYITTVEKNTNTSDVTKKNSSTYEATPLLLPEANRIFKDLDEDKMNEPSERKKLLQVLYILIVLAEKKKKEIALLKTMKTANGSKIRNMIKL